MHKEVVKRTGNTFLIVIAMIVSTFVCISVIDSIAFGKYAVIADIFSILLLTLTGMLIVRYRVMDIKYVLIDKDVIFHRILGSRDTIVLNVSLDEVLIIARCGHPALNQYKRVEKSFNLCGSLFNKDKYCGIYSRDGKTYRFIFQPSPILLKLLDKSIPGKIIG